MQKTNFRIAKKQTQTPWLANINVADVAFRVAEM
jgi:hypothetical protein